MGGLRKPVYGVGINDADYVTNPKVEGKSKMCPYYLSWKNMLHRCYDKGHQSKFPRYIGCAVVEEWQYFMCFREWMLLQDWKGKLPRGVSFRAKFNKYVTQCRLRDAKSAYSKFHATLEEAVADYKRVKVLEIRKHMAEQTDERVINGLEEHIYLIESGVEL